jgi:hypothetical protein
MTVHRFAVGATIRRSATIAPGGFRKKPVKLMAQVAYISKVQKKG